MAFAILRRLLPSSPKPAAAPSPMPSVRVAPADPSSAPSTPTDPPCYSSGASAAEPSASSTTTAEGAPACCGEGVPEEVRELREVCGELDEAVSRFLAEEVEDEVLRGVQAKVRESMAVIAEALERYR